MLFIMIHCKITIVQHFGSLREAKPMNPPQCDNLGYISTSLSLPKEVFTCTEAARCQPEGQKAPAYDALWTEAVHWGWRRLRYARRFASLVCQRVFTSLYVWQMSA